MGNPIQQQSLEPLRKFFERAYQAQLVVAKSGAAIQQVFTHALESQLQSSHDFAARALSVRDITGIATSWPDVLGFLRDSAEAAYRANQQVCGAFQDAMWELATVVGTSVQDASNALHDAADVVAADR